ncbi:MAG: YdeI/OmpD-associated family protein [Flavobacteriales bacterium]
MNPKVDAYLDEKANDWQRPILDTVRKCVLACGLKEEIKWGIPSYNHHGNVLGFAAFKHHCGLWFHEGALLKDKAKVLQNAQEGKTTAMRQWRFEEGDTVDEKLLKQYVSEASLNMEKGIKTPKKKIVVEVPGLLQKAMEAEPEVLEYFNSLAPSHRREYAQHISEAKQEATQLRRLDKSMKLL